jgi:hypothetical protein
MAAVKPASRHANRANEEPRRSFHGELHEISPLGLDHPCVLKQLDQAGNMKW